MFGKVDGFKGKKDCIEAKYKYNVERSIYLEDNGAYKLMQFSVGKLIKCEWETIFKATRLIYPYA